MVIEKFVTNPKIKVNILDYVLPTRLAIPQVMEGMNRSLEEIKQATSSAKLASKHVIILATINEGPTSSMRNIAKVLGVQTRNISITMQRCKIISDTCDVLWSLSIRKKRTNGSTIVAKIVVVGWWAYETQVSPNKANVTTH
jgi:hypothetical protein